MPAQGVQTVFLELWQKMELKMKNGLAAVGTPRM